LNATTLQATDPNVYSANVCIFPILICVRQNQVNRVST